MPSRKEVLETALAVVSSNRQTTYGTPENSFSNVAGLWSVYLGMPVMPHDVAAMLALLKIARLKNSPTYADNWVDLAGYAACGSEVADATCREPTDGDTSSVPSPEPFDSRRLTG